jgi:hypothetical protein
LAHHNPTRAFNLPNLDTSLPLARQAATAIKAQTWRRVAACVESRSNRGMLSSDENENKPIGKGGQRKKADAAKKGEPRKRKEARSPAPKPDQLLEALQRLGSQEPVIEPMPEQASAPVMSSENSPSETPLPDMSPVAAAAPAATTPVSLQAIADAYGDYSKKSIEQASTFVAQLATIRSLSNAFELQTAFARETYETFVAESKRIRDLHRELAKQRLSRLEGFVGMTRAR